MRALIAATLLAWAAFDLPSWVLDRAGLALLALAFVALDVGATAAGARRALLFAVPPPPLELPDDFEAEVQTIIERIGQYGSSAS